MKRMKRFYMSLLTTFLTVVMITSGVSASEVDSSFIQNIETTNTYGFVNNETDQFVAYSDVAGSSGAYTSLASKIYKPISGDTLIVVFHGNGEGGVDGVSNNYTQIAGNRLAVTFTTDEIQSAFKGAYVLALQAPDYWYNDYTTQAKSVIDQAVAEFGINQVFVAGLSAGGLMTQRMLAKYGDFFEGALISCAAISKNDQYVEGLGGIYDNVTEYLDDGDSYMNGQTFYKPDDYDTYLDNYIDWLTDIAESNVPIFLVHGYYDATIYYNWTIIAYNTIKGIRDNQGLDGEIHCSLLEDVSYPEESYSTHWSWVKMLNGHANNADNLDTITWFTSLSTSTNIYQPKVIATPTAGSSSEENTYMFNLQAKVTNSGEKIVAIEIDMNGKEVDESKLTVDMFSVTGYSEDATNLAVAGVDSYGLFGSELEPDDITVKDVYVNAQGNIVLDLATQNGVLNYTSLARNLPMNIRYNIDSVALPLVDTASNPTPKEDEKIIKSGNVKTGDNTNIISISGILILSVIGTIVIKKDKTKKIY